MNHPTRLSVNVDHVATLREARGTTYPSPFEAARLALAGGATGITVHLRSDRRHIQESDVVELRGLGTKINLEMAATEAMVTIARDLRPDQVTLVPERPEEVTTEGGLDLVRLGDRILHVSEQLRGAGIQVSLFLDPDPRQIDTLLGAPTGLIEGFEINTDAYSKAEGSDRERELEVIHQVARQGGEGGVHVYAGHGLTTENVGAVSALPEVEELNIGHFLIGRAVTTGLQNAVAEMLAAMSRPG